MGPVRATEWRKGDFHITTALAQLDMDVIHGFLARESYWASGIPRATVEKSMQNSLCFGLFHGKTQIGFARVISDRATFAYLADVFVLSEYRGQGLAKWLMECIMAHPDLRGLRRWLLVTRDAHGLYQKSGFTPLAHPERLMEIHSAGVYAPQT
ncbi:MAG: GNAT family N-acetyltransferase [Candidatus Acidiferrales bacterium]